MGKVRRGQGYGFLIGNLLLGAIGSLIGWFLMGFLTCRNPQHPGSDCDGCRRGGCFLPRVGFIEAEEEQKV